MGVDRNISSDGWIWAICCCMMLRLSPALPVHTIINKNTFSLSEHNLALLALQISWPKIHRLPLIISQCHQHAFPQLHEDLSLIAPHKLGLGQDIIDV